MRYVDFTNGFTVLPDHRQDDGPVIVGFGMVGFGSDRPA
jgi:hypothetical protein